ncbi:RNA 2',3'-cyclic phosphodiesterase [Neotabrizicola sp. VNH66]|uniref:RNA 2',3'-cyclic phosphodiesterase n=1 Tax=Neotabrizicola sp. VNH66 TaxID=3400918 RepID=UPI003C11886F
MRAFLGLDPPDHLRSALVVQQFLLPLQQSLAPETFHLTLVFLGDLTPGTAPALDEALSALRMPAFDLSLAGLGLFGGEKPRAVWAGVAPSDTLIRLQAKAEQAARRAGIDVPARRFVPHVTLGRFARLDPETQMRLERAVAAGTGFTAGPWPVREMVLWESLPSPKGPRYRELARYPLEQATDRGAVS